MTVFPVTHAVKKNAYKKAVNGFLPSSVVIPLYLEEAGDCEPLVSPGEHVEEGQLIASAPLKGTKFNVNVYSPIPGNVMGIELTTMPRGKTVKGMRIALKGSFTYLGKKKEPQDLKFLTPGGIVKKIGEHGIINTFVTGEPKAFAPQLDAIHLSRTKLLVVRMFDEDPSRMADQLISSLFLENVFAGAEYAAKGMDADGIIFIVDQEFADRNLLRSYNFKFPVAQLIEDPRKYPSTFISEICQSGKKVFKDAPFCNLNKNDLFTDSSTVFEVFRSLSEEKPVIDRYVHVSGDCIPASGLIKVALGTTLESLAEHCGGFLKKPSAVVINGMINGVAVETLTSPVTKYVKSVTFLPALQTPDQRQSVCIRCGNCRRVCPRKLSPDIIYRNITGSLNSDQDYLDSSVLCVNCGLCNSVCPSRLPLSQRIYDYKNSLENTGDENE